MNESIKITVVSTGIMVVGAGAGILDKMPKTGTILIIVGAFIVGIGIFWIIYQLNKRIKKLEELIRR